MGSTNSKQDEPMMRLTAPEPSQIDVSDRSKLSTLNSKRFDLPKFPGANLIEGSRVMAEAEGKDQNLIAFDLSKDYDMNKFTDRFRRNFNAVNPMLFLNNDDTIKKA